MPTSFEYAVIRVVPRVEREEFLNAGVILFSLESRFLKALVQSFGGFRKSLSGG
jgi:hypothetical protein